MKRILKKTITIIFILALMTGTVQTAQAASIPAQVSLTVKQTAAKTVTLTWKKVSGADGYEIYRKTGASGTYTKIKTVTSGSTLTYKNTSLTAGKKYYYKVRAYDKQGSKTVRGKYSAGKSVTVTNYKPVFTVSLPSSVNRTEKTIKITITNSSKSDSCYFDPAFALEDLSNGGKVHNLKIVSYEKPEKKLKGNLSEGKRLLLRAGEKVILTCNLDSVFDYDKNKAQLTACLVYKQKDYVSVYSIQEKNRIFDEAGYYEYLTGSKG
ncbi:MAG: fibronectin type III domain-containing protein [Firmicutes bacterium]|nr:fibronectin type III domain-containing protein [Bacillota bacterium]